ncbi:hypothetical protein [Enteractinococcus coprophilus]|uniref:Uncharacterized protein n=1 Tax=Enteractinococcus coprophilus TaxID=1027633 RepID=A0A543AP17_9MICC|nr:hypothetical protein [Enteractinococcus coprophilus]TQL74295.1 hypothetical protein FB556_0755 [Enteractinococcus coprophilus]
MVKHRTDGLSSWVSAIMIYGVFIMVAIVGPVFFSQPDHLYQQVAVSVWAFLTFVILGGLQLGSRIRLRGWFILLVFVIGYVVLFLLRDADFRPDQHWFVMSPLGWIAGVLTFGNPDLERAQTNRPVVVDGITVQCWSARGRIETLQQSAEELIKQLDGRNLTLVQFIRDTTCLEVAGGLHGRLVMYYSDDRHDDDSWFVYSESNPTSRTDSNEQLMFIGDVEGYIPERFWCSSERAQVLTAEFTRNSRIDTAQDNHWLNPGPMAGGTRPSLSTES